MDIYFSDERQERLASCRDLGSFPTEWSQFPEAWLENSLFSTHNRRRKFMRNVKPFFSSRRQRKMLILFFENYMKGTYFYRQNEYREVLCASSGESCYPIPFVSRLENTTTVSFEKPLHIIILLHVVLNYTYLLEEVLSLWTTTPSLP